jgi:putative addiction module component (TIGR02574 family)
MTHAVNNILGTALALSPRERAEIASRLIESLEGAPPTSDEQAAIDAAWDAEIGRRVKQIDDGTVKLVDADEVFASARAKLAALRGEQAK